MNLIIFLTMVVGSFLVVRIAAIAFELTGLDWTLAKFQALSCFTSTGYTTKESELITRDPQRRRIASILMILGHAGLIMLIATFVNSLSHSDSMHRASVISTLSKLVITAAFILAGCLIFAKTSPASRLNSFIKSQILKRGYIQPMSYKQLLIAVPGYEITSVRVRESDIAVNMTLDELKLKEKKILILALEREEDVIAEPPGDTALRAGDIIICFGRLGDIKGWQQ